MTAWNPLIRSSEDGGQLLLTDEGDDGPRKLRVWSVDLDTDLDAPARRGHAYRFSHARIAQRVLLASGERVGLLTNGVEFRILISDPARPDSQVTISIDPSWKRSRTVPDSYLLVLALPPDDVYQGEIQSRVEGEANCSLMEFSESNPEIPVFCGCGMVDDVGSRLTLGNAMEFGPKSAMAEVYDRLCSHGLADKFRAVFLRTVEPCAVNYVVHPLNGFRTCWDEEILHVFRLRGYPLFVERRTTFCSLFTRIGMWARDRHGFTLPMDWTESDDDLRKLRPDDRLGAARRLVRGWG